MNSSTKGTTAECLAHFATRSDSITAMWEMLPGVNIRTVERWLKEKHQEPVGEYLIKVRVCLASIGYHVVEFDRLHPAVQTACKMFALGLASIDDLVSEFGYEAGNSGRSQLFVVLRGHGGMTPERLSRVAEIMESFGTMIADEEIKFKARFGSISDVSSSPAPSDAPPREHLPVGRKDPIDDRNAITESLAHSIVALLPLAERLLSENYSPEDRERLRALAGGTGVFKLATALHRLCGERVRSTSISTSKGGAQ